MILIEASLSLPDAQVKQIVKESPPPCLLFSSINFIPHALLSKWTPLHKQHRSGNLVLGLPQTATNDQFVKQDHSWNALLSVYENVPTKKNTYYTPDNLPTRRCFLIQFLMLFRRALPAPQIPLHPSQIVVLGPSHLHLSLHKEQNPRCPDHTYIQKGSAAIIPVTIIPH